MREDFVFPHPIFRSKLPPRILAVCGKGSSPSRVSRFDVNRFWPVELLMWQELTVSLTRRVYE